MGAIGVLITVKSVSVPMTILTRGADFFIKINSFD
jgi:hypothetical protein